MLAWWGCPTGSGLIRLTELLFSTASQVCVVALFSMLDITLHMFPCNLILDAHCIVLVWWCKHLVDLVELIVLLDWIFWVYLLRLAQACYGSLSRFLWDDSLLLLLLGISDWKRDLNLVRLKTGIVLSLQLELFARRNLLQRLFE